MVEGVGGGALHMDPQAKEILFVACQLYAAHVCLLFNLFPCDVVIPLSFCLSQVQLICALTWLRSEVGSPLVLWAGLIAFKQLFLFCFCLGFRKEVCGLSTVCTNLDVWITIRRSIIIW